MGTFHQCQKKSAESKISILLSVRTIDKPQAWSPWSSEGALSRRGRSLQRGSEVSLVVLRVGSFWWSSVFTLIAFFNFMLAVPVLSPGGCGLWSSWSNSPWTWVFLCRTQTFPRGLIYSHLILFCGWGGRWRKLRRGCIIWNGEVWCGSWLILEVLTDIAGKWTFSPSWTKPCRRAVVSTFGRELSDFPKRLDMVLDFANLSFLIGSLDSRSAGGNTLLWLHAVAVRNSSMEQHLQSAVSLLWSLSEMLHCSVCSISTWQAHPLPDLFFPLKCKNGSLKGLSAYWKIMK